MASGTIKKGMFTYHYEENDNKEIIIYAHRFHRLCAFLLDIVLILCGTLLISFIAGIFIVGPLADRASKKGVSGNVDIFIYAGLLLLIIFVVGFIILIRYSNYCEKHKYCLGQKAFHLYYYQKQTIAPGEGLFGKEIAFWIVVLVCTFTFYPLPILI